MRELTVDDVQQVSGAWCPMCLVGWALFAFSSGTVMFGAHQEQGALILAGGATLTFLYIFG